MVFLSEYLVFIQFTGALSVDTIWFLDYVSQTKEKLFAYQSFLHGTGGRMGKAKNGKAQW